MLVDDNDTDNFISKRIIEITKFANRVEVKNSGKSALDYLRENQDNAEQLAGNEYTERSAVALILENPL